MTQAAHKRQRECQTCGAAFVPHLTNAKRGFGIYCSVACHRARPPVDERVRFERFVSRDGSPPPHSPSIGNCWEWTGALDRNGYGLFMIRRRERVSAHRAAWFYATGRWPSPCALHRCDNPRCVRVDHLFEGTQADNVRDMISKKRAGCVALRGEAHGRAKITVDDVRASRILKILGASHTQIATRLRITHSLSSAIWSRRVWRHT